jgi:hypothetical protein
VRPPWTALSRIPACRAAAIWQRGGRLQEHLQVLP